MLLWLVGDRLFGYPLAIYQRPRREAPLLWIGYWQLNGYVLDDPDRPGRVSRHLVTRRRSALRRLGVTDVYPRRSRWWLVRVGRYGLYLERVRPALTYGEYVERVTRRRRGAA